MNEPSGLPEAVRKLGASAHERPFWKPLGGTDESGKRPPKLTSHTTGRDRSSFPEIGKRAADAARLFSVHLATMSRLLVRALAVGALSRANRGQRFKGACK